MQLGTFESFASNDMIAQKFKDVGFVDVSVSGSGKTRVAQGMWSKPSQEAEIPKQVSGIKKILI